MSQTDDPREREERGRGGIRGNGGSDSPSEVSFLRLLTVLLEHRRVVTLVPLAFAVLFVAGSMLLPARYMSSGTFLPQDRQQSQLSQFSGLASQIGMSLPVSLGGGQSPAFYAELMRSQNLLSQVVRDTYPAAGSEAADDPAGATLVEHFDVEGETRPIRVANAVTALRDRMNAASDPETGVVSLRVTTDRPTLSKQVADRVLDLVNVFNLERRRSQAQAEREFLEGRVDEARSDLASAEDSLESFLEGNRSFQNSPTLRFRYQDLQRQVDMEQQVYTSLMQNLQQARIEEVRSTPVITVVEPPRTPAKPEGANLILVALLGLVVGGIVAVAWALGHQYVASTRESQPEEYARFAELRREAASDLRRLWRRLPGTS